MDEDFWESLLEELLGDPELSEESLGTLLGSLLWALLEGALGWIGGRIADRVQKRWLRPAAEAAGAAQEGARKAPSRVALARRSRRFAGLNHLTWF